MIVTAITLESITGNSNSSSGSSRGSDRGSLLVIAIDVVVLVVVELVLVIAIAFVGAFVVAAVRRRKLIGSGPPGHNYSSQTSIRSLSKAKKTSCSNTLSIMYNGGSLNRVYRASFLRNIKLSLFMKTC